jgi:hypothetical protein
MHSRSTHDPLLAVGGLYADLGNRQFHRQSRQSPAQNASSNPHASTHQDRLLRFCKRSHKSLTKAPQDGKIVIASVHNMHSGAQKPA